MTISKGESWGSAAIRPGDLVVADDDAHLARLLQDPSSPPTTVASGDLHRTIGGRPIDDREELLALPVDLMHVTLDAGDAVTAVAHAIARRPWSRGGWLCGEFLAVMNAEFVGEFDVAPRGHPNDGRVETLFASGDLAPRQRLAVRRRLRTGRHLPHPQISTRSVKRATWEFASEMVVHADGRRLGVTRTLTIVVLPDAATLYA